jgi:NitT/TauT family transport system substrate-binding protein
VDGATISWVSMPVPQMGPNLASGSIDAATQFVVGKPAIEAVSGGRKAVVLPFSDHLTDLYGNGLAVTRKAAADDPERVRRFNDAMLRGLRYAIDHPAEAGRIYARYQKLQPEAVAAAETTLMGPYVTDGAVPIGALSPERVTRNIAAIRDAGVIPAEFAPGDTVTFDFAPKG